MPLNLYDQIRRQSTSTNQNLFSPQRAALATRSFGSRVRSGFRTAVDVLQGGPIRRGLARRGARLQEGAAPAIGPAGMAVQGLGRVGSSILSYIRGPTKGFGSYLRNIGVRAGIVGGLAGLSYGVSRAVTKSDLPSELKVAVGAGASAVSPFGVIGTITGGVEKLGGDVINLAKGVWEDKPSTDFTDFFPAIPSFEIDFPEINLPSGVTNFPDIQLPSVNTSIVTGGGGAGLDPALLALLLVGGAGGVGYALGRRKKKKKQKSKKRKRSRKR